MSLILNIDTAQETASVSISKNGILLGVQQNDIQKDHATFLHPAIKQLLLQNQINMKSLDAVAVTVGPGSYTGLRVGMAAAKGICHALKIPLISVCTLKTMANSVRSIAEEKKALICPMIDARRMEVFTALFSTAMETVVSPTAMILDQDSLSKHVQENIVLFLGSGSSKFKPLIDGGKAVFLPQNSWVESMCELTYDSYQRQEIADIATLTPNYLKEYQA